MSKRIAFLLTGLVISINSVGCCGCLSGWGANRCQPCGGCPTGGAYYAPQSTMAQSYDQTAYAGGYTQTASVSNGAIIGAPIMASPGGYTQTVVVPTNSLPPY
jgi:hypothetical protein